LCRKTENKKGKIKGWEQRRRKQWKKAKLRKERKKKQG
jgi:hypothetical protein